MFSESAALVVVQALSLFLQCLGLAVVLAVRRCLNANTALRTVRSTSRGPAGRPSGSVPRAWPSRGRPSVPRSSGRKVSDGVPEPPAVLPSELQESREVEPELWPPPGARP